MLPTEGSSATEPAETHGGDARYRAAVAVADRWLPWRSSELPDGRRMLRTSWYCRATGIRAISTIRVEPHTHTDSSLQRRSHGRIARFAGAAAACLVLAVEEFRVIPSKYDGGPRVSRSTLPENSKKSIRAFLYRRPPALHEPHSEQARDEVRAVSRRFRVLCRAAADRASVPAVAVTMGG